MKHKFNASGFVLCILCVTASLFGVNSTTTREKIEGIVIGEKVKIHSDVLDEDRTILIGLPKRYHKFKQSYPVLYLLDAEFFFQQAVAAVQFLSECEYIRNQPIPQMIIVGIVNVDRNRDFTPTHAPKQMNTFRFPTSGKVKVFLKFLETELFPYIETNYKTHPYRIIAGWSLGGLFTVYTFFEKPELFSAYLAISPSLWWDKDMYLGRADSYLTRGQVSPKPFTVTLGALEGGDMGRTVRNGLVPLMEDKLGADKSYEFIEISGEGHSYVPYKALYEGLLSLYRDWMMPNKILEEGFQGIESFYKKLSKKYGYKVNIPESAYSRLASKLDGEGEKNEALEIAKRYLQAYPESSYAHFYLGIRYQSRGDMKSAVSCYQKAIEVEKATSEPDSERIIMYEISLDEVMIELKKKNRK